MNVNQSISCEGQFSFMVLDHETGNQREIPFFNNMLLDTFFEWLRTNKNNSYWYNATKWCRVGTGTTPPIESQTTLVNTLASTTGGAGDGPYSETGYIEEGNTWRAEATLKFTFPLGAVVGSISEVGFSSVNTPTNVVHSRALIKDVNGNPTTITIAATEQLFVTYKIILRGSALDSTGSFQIGTTTYNWTYRRNTPFGTPLGLFFQIDRGVLQPFAASNGVFGPAKQDPTGTSGTVKTPTLLDGLVAGQKRAFFSFGTTEGNVTGGIKILNWSSGFGKFEITPPIPKDADSTFTITLGYTIGRA